MRYLNYLFMLLCFFVCPYSAQCNEQKTNKRLSQYNHISKKLIALDDEEIRSLLQQGRPLKSSWGAVAKVEIGGVPLFVKLIPLNHLESEPQNIKSTENFFGLPLYYQYGVGSGGFNTWREVSAHLMTSDWVLTGENQNFPLMYHWRIIEIQDEKPLANEEEIKKYVSNWENSLAIEARVRANQQTSKYVVLLMEYLPETLKSWLKKQFQKGNDAIDQSIAMVDRNLQETVSFLNKKGVIHFDAHFLNILTDGERLYLTDFGLTTSSWFALSKEEQLFLQLHANYDRYFVTTKLANWIVGELFGRDRINEILQNYVEGRLPILPDRLTPYISLKIKHYAPLALRMNRFLEEMAHKSKQTPYPADELDRLWAEIQTKSN